MNVLARWLPQTLLGALFALPLLIGIVGTLLPAFDLLELERIKLDRINLGESAIDHRSGAEQAGQTVSPFVTLIADPRFLPSCLLSLKTGLLATVLALMLTLISLVCAHGTRLWHWLNTSLAPLIAVPHAALAVGLLFLIAPSGWLVRLFSPWASGWERPPIDWVVPDPGGWSLILGLVIKETPFLFLAAAAQLSVLKVDDTLRIGRTLGYSPARCWSRLILPRLYPRIRLTLLIILAFNLSVVDMALLLGPGNPPTFSVFVLSLVNDPDSRAVASAGALLLALGVFVSFALLFFVELLITSIAAWRRGSGKRGQSLPIWRRGGQLLAFLILVTSLLSLILLLVWSVTQRWRYPDVIPSVWTLRHWQGRGALLFAPFQTTLLLALATAAATITATIAWLEFERYGRVPKMDWMWYVPLLVPQVTFLFGWQAFALATGIDGKWLTVALSHWVYSMPYAILLLAVAWREFDPGWNSVAAVLGAGYWKILIRVRLPMLIRPVLQATAVALAVSVAQYLPTLLLGAGRFQTLSIELVTSFGGVDRRIIATLAILQSLLPLLAFAIALSLPSLWISEKNNSMRRESSARSVQ